MKTHVTQIILRILLVCGVLSFVLGLAIVSQPAVARTVEARLIDMWNRQPPAPHNLPPRWEGHLALLGWEAMVLGIVLVILALLLLRRGEQCTRWIENDRQVVVTAVFVMVILWLPVALWGHSAVIFNHRTWFLGDDPMISMRYAKNLAQGHGWVWNPGERVEGYSNPLWTLMMAGCHYLPVPVYRMALVVLILNLLISIGALLLLHRLLCALRCRDWVKAGVLLAFILNRDLLFMTMAGFEIPLMILVLLWSLNRIVREAEQGAPGFLTCFLIGVLAVIRSDAFVLSGLLFLFALLLHDRKKTVLLRMLTALIIPGAHLLFRIWYYGDWLPNTAYLKIGQWDERWVPGLRYAFGFIKHYFLFVIAGLFGLSFTRKKVNFLLAGLIILYTAYVIYTGGDAFHHFRFFLPILPLIFIMAFMGIQKLHLSKRSQALATLICLVTMPVIFPGYTLFTLIPRPADIYNVELGLWIRANTPVEAKVADAWAGNSFYFSERPGIDLLGKSDRVIARMPVQSAEAKAGHNKFDYDYSLGQLKPDYVVANFRLPVSEEEMEKHMTGDWAAAGALYFHPLFQEHCLPYPVQADTWRTIFACDWSSITDKRSDEWMQPSW
ncbi:hypothetical protein JW948_02240 [bacterium]|nr:hypothetical protein [bacterium]